MTASTSSVSRPYVFNNVLKAALFASAAGTILYNVFLAAETVGGHAMSLLSWPFVAGFLRNVHAVAIRPRLILTREGIRCRIWHPVSIPRVFWPAHSVVDCFIAWSEFRGCETYYRNAQMGWGSLFIQTSRGTIDIGSDVFSKSLSQLQTAILDYVEVEFRQPARREARVPEFNGRRFQNPLQIRARSASISLICAVLLADVLAGVALWIAIPDFPVSKWAWVNVVLSAGVAAAVASWSETAGRRVLELRPDGLAMSGWPWRLRLIPWDEILGVRPVLRTTITNGRASSPQVESLEVRCLNRPSVTLNGGYGRRLLDLAELIDPPAQKVLLAWEWHAEGDDIETAAMNAGLPLRGD